MVQRLFIQLVSIKLDQKMPLKLNPRVTTQPDLLNITRVYAIFKPHGFPLKNYRDALPRKSRGKNFCYSLQRTELSKF